MREEGKIVKKGIFGSEEPIKSVRWRQQGRKLLAIIETAGGRMHGLRIGNRGTVEFFEGIRSHEELSRGRGVAGRLERAGRLWRVHVGDRVIVLSAPPRNVPEIPLAKNRAPVGRMRLGVLSVLLGRFGRLIPPLRRT